MPTPESLRYRLTFFYFVFFWRQLDTESAPFHEELLHYPRGPAENRTTPFSHKPLQLS